MKAKHMMKAAIITGLLALSAVPAYANDSKTNAFGNEAFGTDMFADQAHPAFGGEEGVFEQYDANNVDVDALANMAPAAGDEATTDTNEEAYIESETKTTTSVEITNDVEMIKVPLIDLD